jgi:hypothetical protein
MPRRSPLGPLIGSPPNAEQCSISRARGTGDRPRVTDGGGPTDGPGRGRVSQSLVTGAKRTNSRLIPSSRNSTLAI